MQSNTLGRGHKDNVFDTFSKRKKLEKKEVEELTKEGKNAIENPFRKNFDDVEDYKIKEPKIIVPKDEMNRDEVKLLFDIVMDWMNKILEPKRIIVKDLSEDLRDGQILLELVHYFVGTTDISEVAVSEEAQRQKIKTILEILHPKMGFTEDETDNLKWNVNEIHKGNLIAILCLLVKFIQTFSNEIHLPLNVKIKATKVVMKNDKPEHITQEYIITDMLDSETKVGLDSFDTLFASAPEKIDDVRVSLLNFVNGYFEKLDISVQDMEKEFRDGIYLLYLLGLVGNYFIPTHCYNLPAKEFSQKRDNILLAYELMEDAGMNRLSSGPDEIVVGDLKSTMRLLYCIFTHCKDFN